jgi:hypothetical protein
MLWDTWNECCFMCGIRRNGMNIMKGLCGGHFPSKGNIITDTLVQQFSSNSVTHGSHRK